MEYFCNVGERLRSMFVAPGSFIKLMNVYDRASCSFWHRELFIIVITILLIIIIGVPTLIEYRKASTKSQNTNDLVKPVDKITIIVTFSILAVSIIHYFVFSQGYPAKSLALPNAYVSHAFFKYSLFYGCAIGILGPYVAFVSNKNEVAGDSKFTAYWASIFLMMMFGLYFYEFVHHLVKKKIRINNNNNATGIATGIPK
jgi:hypothetical protein